MTGTDFFKKLIILQITVRKLRTREMNILLLFLLAVVGVVLVF